MNDVRPPATLAYIQTFFPPNRPAHLFLHLHVGGVRRLSAVSRLKQSLTGLRLNVEKATLIAFEEKRSRLDD